MTRILRCLPALFFTLALGAQAQQPAKIYESPYYPLKLGTQWTYRSGKELVVIRVDREVPLDFSRDGKDTEKVTGFVLKIGSGPGETTEQVAVLKDGVYRFVAAGKAYRPPLLFFKITNEVVAGGSWQAVCKLDDGKAVNVTFVGGSEKIRQTINGKAQDLQAVKISTKNLQADDREMATTSWFVKDHGLVKQHVRIGKNETTLVLEEFKPAK
jgi:hypothetical protein